MHIPDAYLSPATQAIAFTVMAPVWFVAFRKTARQLTTRQAPLLSIGAAFCFAIQMFNVPAAGGTTAHALGSTLLAILVGPWAAILGLTLSLSIQALLFGDGGILSLGANCFDMGFVACFVGYGAYTAIAARSGPRSPRWLVATSIGSYLGTVAASLSAGVLLGIQPIVAHDAAGHALYCPFGLNVSVPAMVISHLVAAGPAEAIITVAALAYLWQAFPEFVAEQARPKTGSRVRLVRSVALVLALTPIGLIASGDAFGEWDASTLKNMIGYVPAGVSRAHEIVRPLLPDYGFAGADGNAWAIAGYLVSAFVGFGLVAVFTRLIVARPKRTVVPEAAAGPMRAKSQLPPWIRDEPAKLPPARVVKSPWFERTALRMRTTIAKTVASEEIARSSGLLQSIPAVAKTAGFMLALIATSVSQSPYPMAAMAAVVFALAIRSNVPLRPFIERVLGSVVFFGIGFALPLCLRAVSPGPVAVTLLGIELSRPGLTAAAMVLLRLTDGISLAMLWHLTTRWDSLLRSLASLGIPRVFITMAALTYRYLFVTMETLAEMVDARTARQVGALEKDQARTYAGTGAAILFARSLAFTDEMHMAMQSRLYGVNPREAQAPTRHPEKPMLFELKDLNYRYSDGTPALQGVTLDIQKGDRVAILGANGSGKSTLLRILNGLLFASSGVIRFRGWEITESHLAQPDLRQEFRQAVGFVFQNADAQLFNATVYDEVAFGPRQLGMDEQAVRERVGDVLEFLGIGHLSARPPFRLSGGEKRKVAIASVLSMNPQVLMFDEPFLGLDPRSQAWLVRTLRDLQAAGKTTIIATHTMDIVPRIAERAIVLDETHSIVFAGSVTDAMLDEALLVRANLLEESLESISV